MHRYSQILARPFILEVCLGLDKSSKLVILGIDNSQQDQYTVEVLRNTQYVW
jgi:hypothetical protein